MGTLTYANPPPRPTHPWFYFQLALNVDLAVRLCSNCHKHCVDQGHSVAVANAEELNLAQLLECVVSNMNVTFLRPAGHHNEM